MGLAVLAGGVALLRRARGGAAQGEEGAVAHGSPAVAREALGGIAAKVRALRGSAAGDGHRSRRAYGGPETTGAS